MGVMSVVKHVAYASGAFAAHHRWAHRDSLTVPMFHRVLARDDPRWREADPVYAMSADVFEACLVFFKRHYNVVGLDRVQAARRGEAGLPPLALMITLDDGWEDNLSVAAPLLRRHGLPSLLFVAAEAIMSGEDEWWQERVFGAERDGKLDAGLRTSLANDARDPSVPESLRIVGALAAMEPARRDAMIAPLRAREAGRRMMLTRAQLREVARSGMALGGHGHSHAPLTVLKDSADDLRRSRETLMRVGADLGEWTSMSFPHGRYDARVVAEARAAGYQAIFTSDPVLNRTVDGKLDAHRVLGRIGVSQPMIAGRDGRLDEAKLAAWLWRRAIA